MEFTLGLLVGIMLWRTYSTWFLKDMIKKGNIEVKRGNRYIRAMLSYW